MVLNALTSPLEWILVAWSFCACNIVPGQEDASLRVYINGSEASESHYELSILKDQYVTTQYSDTISYTLIKLEYEKSTYLFHVLNPLLLEGSIELHFALRTEGEYADCNSCTSVGIGYKEGPNDYVSFGTIWVSDESLKELAEGHVINHLTIIRTSP